MQLLYCVTVLFKVLYYEIKNVFFIFVLNAGLEKAQAGIKIAGEISITSDMQMIPPLRQKAKN